jgi:hypothetical protein
MAERPAGSGPGRPARALKGCVPGSLNEWTSGTFVLCRHESGRRYWTGAFLDAPLSPNPAAFDAGGSLARMRIGPKGRGGLGDDLQFCHDERQNDNSAKAWQTCLTLGVQLGDLSRR